MYFDSVTDRTHRGREGTHLFHTKSRPEPSQIDPLKQSYNPLLSKLLSLLTVSISKIQESHGLPKLNTFSDNKFRTEYIGEIIKQTLISERERYINELLAKVSVGEREEWVDSNRARERGRGRESETVRFWLKGVKEVTRSSYELEKENARLKKQISKLNDVIREYVNTDYNQRKMKLDCDHYKRTVLIKKQDTRLVSKALRNDLKGQIKELKAAIARKSGDRDQESVLKFRTSEENDDLWRQLLGNQSLESTSEQTVPAIATDRVNKRHQIRTPRRKMALTQRSPVRGFEDDNEETPGS